MRYDYSDIVAFQARARRERAQAVHQLLVAPLVRLVKHAFAPQCTPERSQRAAGGLA
jgi:hypothetical protein